MKKYPFISLLLAAVVAGLTFAQPSLAQSKARPDHLRAAFAERFEQHRIKGIRRAIAAQERHQRRLLKRKGVLGTAVSWDEEGNEVVKVYIDLAATQASIPDSIDGVKVIIEQINKIYASDVPCSEREGCIEADPASNDQPATQRMWHPRPVPIGVSAGHPDVTTGTLGCRVSQGCHVYALSNAHVFANENSGLVGDNILQPGIFDGGIDPDDAVATLFASKTITMSTGANNKIDAAIAQVDTSTVGTTTRTNGYGQPISVSADTALDPDVGMAVKKYGRTTAQTYGFIDAINATVYVGYKGGTARFVEQIIIKTDWDLSTRDFSRSGDSGSLIVHNGGADDRKAVGLLFASGTEGGSGDHITIANPIKFVLTEFDVQIDGEVQ
ncbi:MAG: hypothetical protein ACR2QG_10110 [Gammaproteobacteria bacterium]